MKLKDLFKRKKFASPYYGRGNQPLMCAPQLNRDEQPLPEQPVRKKPAEMPIDWELRRFELMKVLIAQDRRSVVLGKLRATNKQIAANARLLADASIREMQTNPLKSHEEGRDGDAE